LDVWDVNLARGPKIVHHMLIDLVMHHVGGGWNKFINDGVDWPFFSVIDIQKIVWMLRFYECIHTLLEGESVVSINDPIMPTNDVATQDKFYYACGFKFEKAVKGT